MNRHSVPQQPGCTRPPAADHLRSQILGASLVALCVAAMACAPTSSGPADETSTARPDVVLISIDTLRADHLGCYGYHRDTSSFIDQFAASAVLFEQAIAVSYHTAESHMSMFTSVYPAVHGVRNTRGRKGHRIDENIELVTEVFQRNGYRTAGFHGGGNVSGPYGFDRGFERYVTTSTDDPSRWLSEVAGQPFFLFFHTYRVHDPYTPPPPYDGLYSTDYNGDIVSDDEALTKLAGSDRAVDRRNAFWDRVDESDEADIRHLKALYDAEINQVDDELKLLISEVLAVSPEAVIIITSDHGEEFHEHGKFLHDQLYQELLHVPLIIRAPALPSGLRIADRVSLIDLAPTMLDLAGLPPLPHAQGRSLVPLALGRAGSDREIYSEKVAGPRDARPHKARNAALIAPDGLKMIAMARAEPLLFDLETDRFESSDLCPDALQCQQMQRRIEDIRSDNDRLMLELNPERPEGETESDFSDETLEQLRELGYIQ